MTNGLLINGEKFAHFHINIEALPHIWLCTRSHLNFLISEEFFFYHCTYFTRRRKTEREGTKPLLIDRGMGGQSTSNDIKKFTSFFLGITHLASFDPALTLAGNKGICKNANSYFLFPKTQTHNLKKKNIISKHRTRCRAKHFVSINF